MTKALARLAAEGFTWDEEIVALFTPYQTGHLNRFGRYALIETGSQNYLTPFKFQDATPTPSRRFSRGQAAV